MVTEKESYHGLIRCNEWVLKIDRGEPMPAVGKTWAINPRPGVYKKVEVTEIIDTVDMGSYRMVKIAYR